MIVFETERNGEIASCAGTLRQENESHSTDCWAAARAAADNVG